ncbi:MAG: amidase [Alphaproteobacteria bacterium]|nr:amidase [Alphaproteobacteria bacterium]
MAEDLAYLTAAEMLRAYRAKKLSPVEVTRALLRRLARLNPAINAFLLVDEEAALAQARASEARWLKGRPKGLLDGVPTSIKDLMLTRGWPTLRGSRTSDPKGPWPEDAPCVTRLREQGAVLFGKTTTPEFGWKGVTDSALSGVTRNPWNLDKTPGGSSGGAAAALAAGLGPLAIGSDGGGSIRIPAGFSGVFGIKANFGRVPNWPASMMATISHVGPMSRSVRDAALFLNVIALPDSRDWYTVPHQPINWTRFLGQGVKGLRIAFSPALGYAKVDPEVADKVARAARVFARLGAHVEQRDPGFADPTDIFLTHWRAGAAKGLGGLPRAKFRLLEEGLQEFVRAGQRLKLADYMVAVDRRVALATHMRQFHERYDLLLTPTLAVQAFDVERTVPRGARMRGWWEWTPFSYPFNLTQQPACSIPCGFTGAGLPVGLQIVGGNFREDLVFRAAAAYEAAAPIARRPKL